MRLAIPIFLAILASGGISQTTTTRVSVSSTGVEGNGPTTAVTISESGRWVAMQSAATNLVVGDTNGVDDIFLHDRNWAQTSRVSVTTGGVEANGACALPSISGSGERIAFESTASNLVGGYGPISQIYVHDRVAGTTVAASPVAGNGSSSECAISLDGNWVVFHSSATNLVGGDTNGVADVFLCGLETGTITRVSVSSSGTAGNGPSTRAAVSADGRYVTFVSSASNLVAGDTNGAEDVFVHDTQTGITTRVSVGSAGTEGNGAAVAGAISPDGGYVVFASDATNLVFGDTNGARDIFVKVLSSGLTVRASVSSAGTQANGGSFFPGISWYGSEVSFHSLASNLAPGLDSNGARDVFKHDLDTGLTTLISADPSGIAAAGTSWLADLDTGGRVVAFQSDADNLVAGDTNGVSDAFVQLKKATWYIDVARTPPGTGTPGDPFTSIQYGIDRPHVVGGDELLVAPGSYVENLDLGGKSLGLQSLAGAAQTTLDGDNSGLVVTATSGEGPGTSLTGFTISRGSGTFVGPLAYRGAGVVVQGTQFLIESCIIANNGTIGCPDYGGGVYAESSTLDIKNSVIASNCSHYGGSGLYLKDVQGSIVDTAVNDHADGSIGIGIWIVGAESDMVLQNATIHNNRSTNWSSGGMGGGIAIDDGVLVVDTCVFSENAVGYLGGGISAWDASVEVRDTVFKGNYGEGGGVGAQGSWLMMSNCSLEGNYGAYGNGGAFHLGACDTTIQACQIVGNYSGGDEHDGGGLFVWAGSLALIDSTVAGNIACKGGGAYLENVDASIERSSFIGNEAFACQQVSSGGGGLYVKGVAPTTVDGCVFLDNTGAGYSYWHGGTAVFGPAYIINSTFIESVHEQWLTGIEGAFLVNCIARGTGTPELFNSIATYSNILGGYPGLGNIDADPLFWDPNGGDFHLQPSSPCIDAGDPTSPLDPDGSIADMGAFPFDPDYCPPATSYCTPGTTTNGCNALISATGTASATAGSGFDVTVAGVEGQKDGIIFWGKVSQASPWGGGTSYLCIQPPVKRTGAQSSGGAAGSCDGVFELDFNAWMQANPNKAPGVGEVVYMQAWFRDPPSPKGTSLSDGLRFVVCP